LRAVEVMEAMGKVRHRKLALQSSAFLMTMAVPVLLHWAAQANAQAWGLLLLGVMAAGMALALAVS
jgi:hypothetical protein